MLSIDLIVVFAHVVLLSEMRPRSWSLCEMHEYGNRGLRLRTQEEGHRKDI